MRALTPEQTAALQQRIVKRRDFVFFDALELDGETPKPRGFWSGRGNVTIASRIYTGMMLADVSSSSLVGDLVIPGRTVTLSGVAPEVEDLVRGSVLRQRPVEILIGIYDPDTGALIGSLVRDFIGKVDEIEIPTPAKGGAGDVVIKCESASRGLTIKRTETRSDASLKQRNPTDRLYEYTGLQKEKPVYFGQSKGAAKRKG